MTKEQLEALSDDDLQAHYYDLAAQARTLNEAREVVAKEVSFRSTLQFRAKALEALAGMTPDEVARMRRLSQVLAPAGIESEEKVGVTG